MKSWSDKVAFSMRSIWLGLLAVGLAQSAVADENTEIVEEPIVDADRDHWAYQPLRRPSIPDVQNVDWCRTPIDRFVLAKIEAAGLQPANPATQQVLLRRLTFNLTGLPPTEDQVELAYARAPDRDAYDQLVDRLLASRAYGQRWAQHWLDLARFAETDGFEHDKVRPNAWRYRDWVIDALNADLPFDEFVKQQIAGDEIDPRDGNKLIATGFLLCGPDMPDINLQDERRHNFLNEMASTVGSVFLGLQVGCAQCHDHKFDPISQMDFYRLRSFFEHPDLFKEHPVATKEESEARLNWETQRSELLFAKGDFKKAVLKRVRTEAGLPKLTLNDDQLQKRMTDKEKKSWTYITESLAKLEKQGRPPIPMGRVMKERSRTYAVSHLRIRGDFRRLGPVTRPAFPRVVNTAGVTVFRAPQKATSSFRRLALANWLVRRDNPLTARVMVNRVWQHHFGEGLFRSPSNVGLTGYDPTHPELLDWLAVEFIESGWSLKRLHKLILTSATYRQSSLPHRNAEQGEAENVDSSLLTRYPLRRLDGESIRDAMLAVAGTLNQRAGGPGIRPPLPPELVSTLLKNQWPVTKDSRDHHRRSIYLFVRRNLRYPLFEAFDKPDTNASCPVRSESTIAPQALFVLNSDFALQRAKDFAADLIRNSNGAVDAVDQCICRALGRYPKDNELSLFCEFLIKELRRLNKRSAADKRPIPVPAEFANTDKENYAAALTQVCLAIFNLNEFIYLD
ncbi:MAG: hypothetical protein CMJ78_04525 [Planctomycetaceae bacterium]|nr:hypothetical protein [Planctomycetaceae bacterium]